MRKTDKKIENQLRFALTEVCELALENVAGFHWITHLVNYQQFPQSLVIVCVFGTHQEQENAISTQQDEYLIDLIEAQLTAVGIHLKDPRKQVHFDSEEACERENGGKWQHRLRSH